MIQSLKVKSGAMQIRMQKDPKVLTRNVVAYRDIKALSASSPTYFYRFCRLNLTPYLPLHLSLNLLAHSAGPVWTSTCPLPASLCRDHFVWLPSRLGNLSNRLFFS
jgi:hypothetical protein